MNAATLPVERALIGLLVAVVTLANAWWIGADQAPMPHPVDPYVYATKTLTLLDGRGGDGPGEWLAQLSFAGRSPLYQLLSLPFVALLGRTTDAMLATNLVLHALLLVVAFAFGRSLSGARAGLLAAALLAGSPPLIHLSRVYRPHAAVPLFALASLWLLLRVVRKPSVRNAWAFAGSLAAGLLLHPTFAWVLMVPTLVFVPWAVLRLATPFVLRGLLPAGVCALGVTLAWYLAFGGELLAKAQSLRGGAPVRVGFEEIEPSFWWYARTAPAAVGNLLAGLSLVGVLACLAKRRLGPGLVGLSALAGYALESLAWTRAWWYFAAVLPCWSLGLALWIAEIRRPRLRTALTAVALTAAGIGFGVSTWGAPGPLRPLAIALGAPLDTTTCALRRAGAFCATPPDREIWPTRALLAQVLEDAPACRRGERSCRVFLVVKAFLTPLPAGWPVLREAHFEYLLARDWPGARLEFARASAPGCAARAGLESDYIVLFRGDDELAAGCLARWTRFLAQPTPAFERAYSPLASLALPGGRSAHVLERVGRLAPRDVLLAAARIAR
jgi:4-amino-4-deoxy-L-arabinose transferase-like glycosyltransferase